MDRPFARRRLEPRVLDARSAAGVCSTVMVQSASMGRAAWGTHGAWTLVIAVSALSSACGHARGRTPPGARPPEPCTLERVIPEMLSGSEPEARGAAQELRDDARRGVCGHACAEQTRARILDASRARSPFVAVWTGNFTDGSGRRFAVIGRGAGDSYRIAWLEYRLASGSGAHGAQRGPSHERIVARDCSTLIDLRDECGPRGMHRLCQSATSSRAEVLDIGCVTDTERAICDQPIAGPEPEPEKEKD